MHIRVPIDHCQRVKGLALLWELETVFQGQGIHVDGERVGFGDDCVEVHPHRAIWVRRVVAEGSDVCPECVEVRLDLLMAEFGEAGLFAERGDVG